jgi:hypothetical protein
MVFVWRRLLIGWLVLNAIFSSISAILWHEKGKKK